MLELKRIDSQTWMIINKGFNWRPIYFSNFFGGWSIFNPLTKEWSEGFDTPQEAFESVNN